MHSSNEKVGTQANDVSRLNRLATPTLQGNSVTRELPSAINSELHVALDALFVSNLTESKTIAELLGDRQLMVYGAGECSHWFIEVAIKKHGYQPVAVIDRELRKGQAWNGIPAYSLLDLEVTEAQKHDALIIVCVGSETLYNEIRATLVGIGFRHILPLRDIYEIHNPFDQPPEAKAMGLGYYRKQREQIFAAFDLLADEESRHVYLHFLQTHMRRMPVPIPQRPRNEQYFPRDVPLARGHDRYVCCGAYDGDTVRLLHDTCGKVDAIACFEPEAHIYSRLIAYLERERDALAERILTWPCAVHGHSGLMPFIPGNGLGSRVSDEGRAKVQCVTLDQALLGFDPTFISMDIEGVEPDALRGAERLLCKCAPDLGICVYHSPNHAWEIPLYLDSLGVGYKFYLRNYTGFAIETVLYAGV